MQLEEIEKLAAEATPEPWYHRLETPYRICILADSIVNEVAKATSMKNAKFIEASRSWVPIAIRRIKNLERDVAVLEEKIQKL